MDRPVLANMDFRGVSRVLNLPDATQRQEAATLGQVRRMIRGNVLRRHDWDEPYDYLGVGPEGAVDSAAVWRITRLTVSSSGEVIERGQALNVTWIDRFTHNYI